MKASLLISTAFALSGCGMLGNGHASPDKSDGGTPPPVETQEPTMLHFDGSDLAALNLGETNSGKAVSWRVRFLVDGVSQLEGVYSTEALTSEMMQQTFSVASQVSLELTAVDSGTGVVLATNLKPDAAKNPFLAQAWDGACKGVSPNLKLTLNPADHAAAESDLRICDFSRLLAYPVVTVKPVQTADEQHWLTWACYQANDPSHHGQGSVLFSRYPETSTCRAGYTRPAAGDKVTGEPLKLADGSNRLLEVPRDFERTEFSLPTQDAFLRLNAGAPVANRYALTDKVLDVLGAAELPVGEMQDCRNVEVELAYMPNANPDAIPQYARVTFTRAVDQTTQLPKWVAANQAAMPTPLEIYAANQSQFSYWLHCSWTNDAGIRLSSVIIR